MSSRAIREPIVVTGATGFIGRRVLRRLLEEGYRPRAFALPDDPVPIEWGDRVDVVRGDVSKAAQVARGLEDVATVIHLAAVVGDWGKEQQHRRVTVRGTDNVLTEAARQRAHAILTSSVVIYGAQAGHIICHEGQPMGRALGPYSRAKQQQERIAQHLEEQRSLKVTIVRPTNVFGPGSIWVDQAVEQLQAGMPCLIGNGRMCAALTYVDNVVELLVLAASTPAAVGRVYNANDDNGVTWLRYFTELAELCGAPPPKSIPKLAAKLGAVGAESAWRLLRKQGRPPLTREALNLVGSDLRVPIDKARQELGYKPRVSFAEGMREVADYLAAR